MKDKIKVEDLPLLEELNKDEMEKTLGGGLLPTLPFDNGTSSDGANPEQ